MSNPKSWESCLTHQMFVLLFRGTCADWSTGHTGIMWSSMKCTAKNHTARLYTKLEYLADVYYHWLKFLSFLPFFTGITRHFAHTCGIKNYLVATPSCPFKLPSIAVVSSVAPTRRTDSTGKTAVAASSHQMLLASTGPAQSVKKSSEVSHLSVQYYSVLFDSPNTRPCTERLHKPLLPELEIKSLRDRNLRVILPHFYT